MAEKNDHQSGMYLVGRHDGLVDPFFVRITSGLAHHYVDSSLVQHAWGKGSFEWWWHILEVPMSVPDSWADYPQSIKEAGDGKP